MIGAVIAQLWALFRRSVFPFFPAPDPLISRPELHKDWRAEVTVIAHPILCVCVLTAPVRSLAGPMAVGGMKRQLFVSTFYENLWLNLSRAWTSSAVLLSIQSVGRKRNHSPQMDSFQSAAFMPQRRVPANYRGHVTDFKGDRKAIMSEQMCTSPAFCNGVFHQTDVSFRVCSSGNVSDGRGPASFCCLSQVGSTNNFPRLRSLSRVPEHLRLLPRSNVDFSTNTFKCFWSGRCLLDIQYI